MRIAVIMLASLVALSVPARAEEPMLGPLIEGHGPNWSIEDRDVPVDRSTVYKAVFDAGTYSDDLTSLFTRLVSVARFINMHARGETPIGRMDLAIILHGAALKTVFSNGAYRAATGSITRISSWSANSPTPVSISTCVDSRLRLPVSGRLSLSNRQQSRYRP